MPQAICFDDLFCFVIFFSEQIFPTPFEINNNPFRFATRECNELVTIKKKKKM